jgi:hypothetical protein
MAMLWMITLLKISEGLFFVAPHVSNPYFFLSIFVFSRG